MKVASVRKVRRLLRKVGFRKSPKGNATGHEVWSDALGRRCLPVMRRKEIHIGQLYCLAHQLETNGVLSRTEFFDLLQSI